ncbi:toprim domain-containing protein [Candidatus Woesearchaeota archaeon]|nr:MAG: toprim domain-containing protein [Candidatus Woesearchaeota archaeon]
MKLRREKLRRPRGETAVLSRDDLERLLEALHEHRSFLTIVEGKNDKRALEGFGFTNVRVLDGPLYRVVESIDEEEVLILTDLDEHGKQLYRYFYKECGRRGVRVNNRVRQLLTFTTLRQIEGLPRFIERARNAL